MLNQAAGMYPMHGWYGWGWMFVWWAIVVAAVAVVLILLAGASSRSRPKAGPTAEEILRDRYARGEIDRETFQRMRSDLRA